MFPDKGNPKNKNETDCFSCKTKNCFVQRFCNPDWVEIINRNKSSSDYIKGQHFFREGGRVMGLHFIKEGTAKIVSTGLEGRELIVRLAKQGEITGHRGQGAEQYPVGAIALENSVVCFVDNATLMDVFLNNPKFTFELMMYYAAELRKSEIRLRYQAQMTLREKVAECLLYLRDVFGEDDKGRHLKLVFSRMELAALTGTNAEQITRVLSDFEREKLIGKTGKKIEILNEGGIYDIIAHHNRIDFAAQPVKEDMKKGNVRSKRLADR